MDENEKRSRFEECIMPHLDAAYNLARWLSGKDQDAEDIVQDACLRAYKFFGGFRGGDAQTWLLRIVHNAFYDSLHDSRHHQQFSEFNENIHSPDDSSDAPDTALIRKSDNDFLREGIEQLPIEFREILVMRELHGFSYNQIAEVADLPMGTVMSRLARAREELRHFIEHVQKERKIA
jgi:RNA polymerase sigma-70 factor (ECF subfamily)